MNLARLQAVVRRRFPVPLHLMLGGLVVVAALIRVHMALQPGLWVDEIFSLAMATGHSLEQPAAVANPALGDYEEAGFGQPAAKWRQYLQHDRPVASPERVIRAVRLSDTNPPFYYIALSGWTVLVGTSDMALRLFSVVAALACFPLLWKVGQRVGGRLLAAHACLLFGFAPAAVYYSVEGRMYSLTWLVGLALACVSLRLHQDGGRLPGLLAWALAGAVALLTHYFLVFVWVACAGWLLLMPGRISRADSAATIAASVALVLPWYLNVPATLAQWRVTAGWLDGRLPVQEAWLAPAKLIWAMFSPSPEGWYPPYLGWMIAGALLAACVAALRKGSGALLSRVHLLVWFWLAASVTGLVVFDLVRGTSAALVTRYALMGLPAAVLLVGAFLSRMSSPAAGALVLVVLLGWLPGIRSMATSPPRPSYPFIQLAGYLDARTTARDVILVRSIPSGVLGIARYMKGETPIASWVEQLQTRGGGRDLAPLVKGVCQVVVVSIHTSTRVNSAEPWLQAHATLIAEERVERVRVHHFRPDTALARPKEECPHLQNSTS